MAKDRVQPEAIKCFLPHFVVRADGGYTFAVPENQEGRADICLTRSGAAVDVEVKNGRDGFNFHEWRIDQRTYALKCQKEGHPYWIWLCLGTGRPNHTPPAEYYRDPDLIKGWLANHRPRKTWLIPLAYWLFAERTVVAHQYTIPYIAKKGMNVGIQQNSLDAVTLFRNFELSWVNSNDGWAIPNVHLFYQLHMKHFVTSSEPESTGVFA